MKQLFGFIRHHLPTLLIILIALIAVKLAVGKYRAPGSVTPLESQAMDMSVMNAPVGTLPVQLEEVALKRFSSGVTYTGSVVALNTEEIVARVAGRIVEITVYPGQKVKAGQLVALLDSSELQSRVNESLQAASAANADVNVALRELPQAEARIDEARARQRGADASVEDAKAQVEAAKQEKAQAQSELADAQATVASAQADAEYAQAQLSRSEQLYKQGAIALRDLQLTQAQAKAATSKVAQTNAQVTKAYAGIRRSDALITAAQSKIAQARAEQRATTAGLRVAISDKAQAQAQVTKVNAQANQARAQEQTASVVLGYTRLVASQSGIVSERLVSPGTLVQPGQTILRIQSIDQVRIQANVAEADLGGIRKGTLVSISTPSASKIAPLQARVTSVFPAANAESRTFTVEALVPNPNSRFQPGQYVSMSFDTGGVNNAFSVPNQALYKAADGSSYVWILADNPNAKGKVIYTCTMHPEIEQDKPGDCPKCGMALVPKSKSGSYIAKRQTVTPGPSNDTRTLIQQGLRAGIKVIVSQNQSLNEGIPVQPVESGKAPETHAPPADNNMQNMPGM
ncbi:MAG: efflux RND transporter periplasmic adaptor subunit [bacterium]